MWIACLSVLAHAGHPYELPRGYGISPFGFPDVFEDAEALPAAMQDFFDELGRLTRPVLMWNGAWRDDAFGGSDSGEVPEGAEFVQAAAAERGLVPVAVFGWRAGDQTLLNTPGNPTNDWTNPDARRLYVQTVTAYAERHSPPVLLLGNESDFYYAQDLDDYINWIAAYDEAYDAIKSASPGTLVGPVFNYEHLAGAGKLNGWTESRWEALDLHDPARMDVVAATVYPWLGYATPDDVPADHLHALVERIGEIPLIITETAWPAGDPAGMDYAWETTEQAQSEYVNRLEDLIGNIPVLAMLWPFLHEPSSLPDPLDQALFSTSSLIDGNGNPRPAYREWLDLFDEGGGELHLTGAWFDPATSGQGFNLQVSPAGLFGYYYGYDGGGPLWLLVDNYNGPLAFGLPIAMDVLVGPGGVFGDPVDPAAGGMVPWGELVLTFHDCNSAHAILTGAAGMQEFELVLLAGVDGVDPEDCVAPPAQRALAALTGAWYEPATSGQGWNFIQSPAGLFGYFYGYAADGTSLWLITEEVTGGVELGEPVVWTLLRGFGGGFEAPVSPEELEVWGSAEVLFESCQAGLAQLNGLDGTGPQQLVVLAPVQGLPGCEP